jgi:hypothetical protein
MLHKDYDSKVSAGEKKLMAEIVKGLGAKTN